jgi:8-oxo-dGTP pyrophosphatase MutT (NUDIX family)
LLFNDQPGIYYYENDLKPGVQLYKSHAENRQKVQLGKYSVTEVEGILFLIQNESTEEYIGAQMKNGEYQYIYKSFNGEIVIRNEEGEEIYPEDYFYLGRKVKSKNTDAIGHIAAVGVELIMVKSLDGSAFNSNRLDLVPLVDEVKKSDIIIYNSALRNLEELKPYIFEVVRDRNTALLKSQFDGIMQGLKQRDPNNIKLTHTPEPEANTEAPTPTGIMSKITNFFKKPKVNAVPPARSLTMPKPATTVVNPNLNVTQHLGNDYQIIPPNAGLTTTGTNVHKLTHIDLNPNATSDKDKYLYHYEIGQHRDKVATPNYLDVSGRQANPEDSTLINDGVYLPGEKVKHGGQEYDVVSHIAHNPTNNGTVDYTSILAKDKNGKIVPLPRSEVQLSSPDLSNAKKLKLDNGQFKYHHQLQPGDTFTHEGQQHKIIDKHPTKGYISQNTETGKMHFTGSHNFDKDYLSHERPYTAKAGDTIKVARGIFTIKHIGGIDKNTSLVTAIDKDGTKSYFKMPTDKLNNKVVTKTKFEPLSDEEYEKYGIPRPQNVQQNAAQNNTQEDTLKTPIPEGADPQKVQEERFNQQTQNISKNLGNSETIDHGDNEISHHLGIADVRLRRKLGGIPRIENGRFQVGKDKQGQPLHDFEIMDYDPNTNDVRIRKHKKGELPTKENIDRNKPQLINLDKLKEFIGNEEAKLKSGKMPETLTAEWKHGGEFKKKALDVMAKHYADKGITNPSKEQIEADDELHKKLQPHLSELENNLHAAKTKGSVLTGNKEKIDIHKQFAKMEAGDDPLHKQIADKIQNTSKEQEKNKKEAQVKLTNTMGQFYHQQNKQPDLEQLKRDIKNPGIHGDDGVLKEHNEALDNFEKNGGDYNELHNLVKNKVEEKNKLRYDKLDRAVSDNPDINNEEDLKKFFDDNKDKYGPDAHEFFTKEEKRRTELANQEKEANKAQREEEFKNYKPIFDKNTHDILSKHHSFDKLDTPEIEKHLKNMLDYENDYSKSKGSGLKNNLKAKAEQESRKLSALGIVNRFHEGKVYIKNPDAASGESPISLKKEKRAEGFDLDSYEVPEKHTKPLSEDEHKDIMHAVDEFTGTDSTGKRTSNLIKLADESKQIPDSVFTKGIADLKKNENSKEAQIIREHIDKIQNEGVRANPTGKGYFTPEEIKDKLNYRRSGEHAVDKRIRELRDEVEPKLEIGDSVDDVHMNGELENYMGKDKFDEYEKLLQQKAKFNPDNEIPFGQDIEEPKKEDKNSTGDKGLDTVLDEIKNKGDEGKKTDDNIAWRGSDYTDEEYNPPFGPSGYYKGRHFAIGDKAKETAQSFGKHLTQADLSKAKLYEIKSNGDKGNGEGMLKLKEEAKAAGYEVHPGSGHVESQYLKDKGYDGIKAANEVVLFDHKKFVKNDEKKSEDKSKQEPYSVEDYYPDENKHRPEEQLKFNQGTKHEPVRIIGNPDLIKLIGLGAQINKAIKTGQQPHEDTYKQAKELGDKLGISASQANLKAKYLAKKHRHEDNEKKIVIKDLEGFKKINHDEKVKKSITCTCGESWNNLEKSFHNLYICDKCGNELEKSLGEAADRQIGSIAVMSGDKILMGKRRDSKKWTLPGGHIEPTDYSIKSGTARELHEETGMGDVKTSDLEKLGTEEVTAKDEGKLNIHCYRFKCDENDFPQTTMQDDPDSEVERWEWIKTPIKQEILDNLHAPKNVTLKLLGLQQWK